MRKITLLLFTILSIGYYTEITAQVFHDENFDGLTVGNVGTDITGATAGQGDLLTFTNPGQNSDFQIVSEGGALGNVVQITGTPTETGTKFLWKDGFNNSWASRDSGNEIIEIEYDFYSGGVSTSKNVLDAVIADSAFNIIAGFEFVPETKVLIGLVLYGTGTSLGLYTVPLGENTDIVLAANTWYRVGCSFNKTTGEVVWKGPGFYTGIIGAAAGTDPAEVDYILFPGTGNTVSSIMKLDAMSIKATAIENLLGINDVPKTIANTIKLYPNPVEDVLTLSMSNTMSLTKLEIVDINGRLIKSIPAEKALNNQIDTSKLSQGLYLLNIYSEEGKMTKRFIKN